MRLVAGRKHAEFRESFIDLDQMKEDKPSDGATLARGAIQVTGHGGRKSLAIAPIAIARMIVSVTAGENSSLRGITATIAVATAVIGVRWFQRRGGDLA